MASTNDRNPTPHAAIEGAIEAAIRIGVIALLAVWAFQIIAPFISPILWGVIIAVAAYPVFRWLARKLGGRTGLAATVFTLLALLILITPTIWLTGALIEWGQTTADQFKEGTLAVPAPPDSVAEWPIIGERLHRFWALAHSNLQQAMESAAPQLKAAGGWMLGSAAAAGKGVLLFTFSIIIAGVFLANAQGAAGFANSLFTRLAPESGKKFARLSERTVRSVATGVVGVAIIQTVLVTIGFVLADVPAAAFLAMICLLLAVIQLPLGLVVIPVIIYVWANDTTLVALLFTIWSVPAMLSDNVLKPILLARGVEAPMLVIFLGAIGGFVLNGIIGLFTGAVILVLAYELFQAWLTTRSEAGVAD